MSNASERASNEPIVLCTDRLRPGDIVLSTIKKNPVSWLIRSVTASQFSHVALHVGGGFLVEAVRRGIRKTHGRRFMYESSDSVRVLRCKGLDSKRALKAVNWAKGMVYRPYSVSSALLSVFPVRFADDVGRFCSELVSESFEHAGRSLFGSRSSSRIVPGHFTSLVPAECDDVTDDVTRRLAVDSLDRAVESFQGRLIPFGSRGFEMDGEALEALCLKRAAEAMSNFDCFHRPYHLIDVLKQLVRKSSIDATAVADVDSILNDVLEKSQASTGAVKPREAIPGITPPTTAAAQVLPIWDAGETSEQAFEFRRLGADLYASAQWDIKDLHESLSEARLALNSASLASLHHIVMWLEWDKWYAQQNYQLFGRIANSVSIPIE